MIDQPVDWYRVVAASFFMLALLAFGTLLIVWCSKTSSRVNSIAEDERLRDLYRWHMWGPENIKTWDWWEIYTKC